MTLITIHGNTPRTADAPNEVEVLGPDGIPLHRTSIAPDGSWTLNFDVGIDLPPGAGEAQLPRLAELAATPQGREDLRSLLRALGHEFITPPGKVELLATYATEHPGIVVAIEQKSSDEYFNAQFRFSSPQASWTLSRPVLQQVSTFSDDVTSCIQYQSPTQWNYFRDSIKRTPRIEMLPQNLAKPRIGDDKHLGPWAEKFKSRALKWPAVYSVMLVRAIGVKAARKLLDCIGDDPTLSFAISVSIMLVEASSDGFLPGKEKDLLYAKRLAKATTASDAQEMVRSAWKAIYGKFEDEDLSALSMPRDRSAEALTISALNGICPAYFYQDQGSSDLHVQFEWRWSEVSNYKTPSVRARFSAPASASDSPVLQEITYRWGAGPEVTVPRGGDEGDDFSDWGYAKRLLRINLLLAGEIDCHISRGHLLAEQYQAALWCALYAVHGNRQDRWEGDAIYRLLMPHIFTAAEINNYGNPLIFSSDSIICRASGLNYQQYSETLTEQLGALDWKGWQPRVPLCDKHKFAHVARLYWDVVKVHVKRHFESHEPDAAVLDGFSSRLSENSPPVPAWYPAMRARLREGDRVEFPDKRAGAPSMSPVTSLEDLERLCCHAIFHATFYHGWINDRQIEDGGDVLAASFGLRSTDPPRAADEAALHKWNDEVSPSAEDTCFQLFLADSLSMTRHGYFTRYMREDHAALAALTSLLEERKTSFEDEHLKVPLHKIRALINI